MIEKKQLRKDTAVKRATAHAEVDPTPALDHLRAALEGAEGPISFYWPIRSELDPRPVMEELAATHQICLPVTSGYNPLTFRQWTPGAAMDEDGFGVAIPAGGAELLPKTLVIPLLAFDRHGQRLGYGAGHYDRTLDKLRKLHSVRAIGFAYAAQECDRVPTEPTDQPLTMIVTEEGVLAPEAAAD